MTSRVAIAIQATDYQFAVPFPYLSDTHVVVAFNRLVTRQGLDFFWRDSQNIEFYHAPGKGVLEIIRQTPVDRALVAFHNGSVLTQDELNLAFLQALYATEETRDYYDALVNGALDSLVLQSGAPTAGPVIDKVIEKILDSEQLKELQGRIADIDTNAAGLLSQQIQLSNLDDVLGAFADVSAKDVATFLKNLQQQVVDGDSALASDMSLIGAKSHDGKGWVLDKSTVQVDPGVSLGDTLNAMQSSIGGVEASVASESKTRADAVSAVSERIDNVEASLSSPTGPVQALITNESNARADADGALGTRVDGVIATVGQNKALFDEEVTTRASQTEALSQGVTTLQSRVGSNEASLQQIGTTVNGLSASYVVKTDVNGNVAGYGLWNDGKTSKFQILADSFAIASNTGAGVVVPFAVDANGVYMNNAYIRNLSVDKITGGAIQSEWALNSTNGRIVLDTGAYMKVIGVGFGLRSDLIEWFGPKMAISQCAKNNAITYVGMDGSAYFGGSLSAGKLYNAAQSSSTAGDAYVIVGPFSSNGNPKKVVVGYSRSASYVNQTLNNRGFTQPGSFGSFTMTLYRTLNGGPEVAVMSQTFQQGTYTIFNERDGASTADGGMGGSFTFTDNTGASNNMTYVVRLSNFSFNAPGGTATGINISARLSCISTEE